MEGNLLLWVRQAQKVWEVKLVRFMFFFVLSFKFEGPILY